ncbi:unnamed protein product [Parajaminaea phylloscopi]
MLLLTLTLAFFATSTAWAGQCTFYQFNDCTGSISIQNVPISSFPAYSSFKCNIAVQACYGGCYKCATFDAGGCNYKTTSDPQGNAVNYSCFKIV